MLDNFVIKAVVGFFIILLGGNTNISKNLVLALLEILLVVVIMWHITYTPAFDWVILQQPYSAGVLKTAAAIALFVAGTNVGIDYSEDGDEDSMKGFIIPLVIGIVLMFLI